jgi:ribonuclease P protein component
VGGAVTRNRVRRRLREIFRRNRDLFGESGSDVVINARPSAGEASFAALREEYRSLVAKTLARSPAKNRSR